VQSINPTYGPAYLTPTGVLGGRLVKSEVQVAL
jgi:hypothetical protein